MSQSYFGIAAPCFAWFRWNWLCIDCVWVCGISLTARRDSFVTSHLKLTRTTLFVASDCERRQSRRFTIWKVQQGWHFCRMVNVVLLSPEQPGHDYWWSPFRRYTFCCRRYTNKTMFSDCQRAVIDERSATGLLQLVLQPIQSVKEKACRSL